MLEKNGFGPVDENGYLPEKEMSSSSSRMKEGTNMGILRHMTGSNGCPTSNRGICGVGQVIEPSSLRIGFIARILSAGLLLTSGISFAQAGQGVPTKEAPSGDFHFPSTSAEQFLDLVMTLEGGARDAELGWSVEGAPWRDARKDLHYARLITESLREAVSREAMRLVRKNCGGKYVEGDNCSFDVNPITCTQDYPEEGYLFRTEKFGRSEAVVSLRWPGLPETVGTYRLIRAGGVWKLDGVRCAPTMSFNMP